MRRSCCTEAQRSLALPLFRDTSRHSSEHLESMPPDLDDAGMRPGLSDRHGRACGRRFQFAAHDLHEVPGDLHARLTRNLMGNPPVRTHIRISAGSLRLALFPRVRPQLSPGLGPFLWPLAEPSSGQSHRLVRRLVAFRLARSTDIVRQPRHVRVVPASDIRTAANTAVIRSARRQSRGGIEVPSVPQRIDPSPVARSAIARSIIQQPL